MSDTPETLDAILAEMRAEQRPYGISNDRIHAYADRIEAAVKRERNAHTNDIHDALYMATGIPGNAAALRTALEWVAEFVELGVDDEYGTDGQNLALAAEKARAAIAAPARNCDRYGTAKDALDAFIREKEITSADVDNMNLRDFFDWLFDKAEGGAE